jgi:hypothetical protein
MVGDLALFNEISTSLKDNCGARWGKRMAKVGQLTEARRLIGVSTPREVNTRTASAAPGILEFSLRSTR